MMDRRTAIAVFEALESERPELDEHARFEPPPTYDVRVDAGTHRHGDAAGTRSFRVRVTPGAESGGISQDDWRFVLDLAQRYELGIDVQNAGMELT